MKQNILLPDAAVLPVAGPAAVLLALWGQPSARTLPFRGANVFAKRLQLRDHSIVASGSPSQLRRRSYKCTVCFVPGAAMEAFYKSLCLCPPPPNFTSRFSLFSGWRRVCMDG